MQIPIEQTEYGSHGDHWGAVFGFDVQDHIAESVQRIVQDLSVVAQVGQNAVRLKSSHALLSFLGVGRNDSLETLYPVLDVTETIPVHVNKILEWSHVNGIEAQVRGAGRETFGLDFFALDYLENNAAYAAGGEQQVALSGLAYVVEDSSNLPENFADDFCAYLPNTEMPCGHDYNFIGDLLSVEDVSALGEDFSVLRVKLIQDGENPEMFNLPILANRKNLHCETPRVGQKLSGCFWLQGRLAGL